MGKGVHAAAGAGGGLERGEELAVEVSCGVGGGGAAIEDQIAGLD